MEDKNDDPVGSAPRGVKFMAWRPQEPIVVAGYTLSTSEAWVKCFTDEWFRLAQGRGQLEHVGCRAIELLAEQCQS